MKSLYSFFIIFKRDDILAAYDRWQVVEPGKLTIDQNEYLQSLASWNVKLTSINSNSQENHLILVLVVAKKYDYVDSKGNNSL